VAQYYILIKIWCYTRLHSYSHIIVVVVVAVDRQEIQQAAYIRQHFFLPFFL